MNIEQVQAILAAMGDGSRLQLLQALLPHDRCVEELAERLKLSASTVSFHLKKLEEAGLVRKTRDQYYSVFRINRDLLRFSLGDLLGCASPMADAVGQASADEKARRAVLRAFMPAGRLLRMPAQRKKRLVILAEIVTAFSPGRKYPEREVDDVLTRFHEDYCNLRRMLVDEGFMGREGGVYWRVAETSEVVSDPTATKTSAGPGGGKRQSASRQADCGSSVPESARKEGIMDRRRELIRAYKETPIPAGVFQIKNRTNGKIYVAGTPNLKAAYNSNSFQLSLGSHRCEGLQKEWSEMGPDAFEFSVLEELTLSEGQVRADPDEIRALEKKWVKKLSPFGERGYH